MRFSTEQARPRRRTEQSYVRAALVALRRLGVPCVWEGALLGRSVDLVFLQGDDVCTVEFKKYDWKRALKQARDHLLGADFAYVCLAERKPTAACFAAAEKAGVGILSYRSEGDWPFEILRPAPRSSETWLVARNRLLR